MQPSLPTCPECGGRRAFFKGGSPAISFRLLRSIEVYWYSCLECGHTTPRVHPNDLKILREAAEKAHGKAPHPCPECEGERVFFKWVHTDDSHILFRGDIGPAYLYACACLRCGYTTKRPHTKDAGGLRRAAEKRRSDRPYS